LAVEKGGEPLVTWSLVAKKGRVSSSSSLNGYTIVSLAAYAPDFIRNVALAHWGQLPVNVSFSANGQILSGLRKAANGEAVAVLLDQAQAASVQTLPFWSELQVVTVSRPVPGIVVSTVGSAMKAADAAPLVDALLEMDGSEDGKSALESLRLLKFVPLDEKSLSAHEPPMGRVEPQVSVKKAASFSFWPSPRAALPPCVSPLDRLPHQAGSGDRRRQHLVAESR
jgi:hypothetical protein